MAYICQIIETEAQPALWVKLSTSISDLPNEIGKAYGSIIAYLQKNGQQPMGPSFVAYYNTDMKNLQIEIGFPVIKEMAGEGDIVYGQIPAGRKASCFYKGPYSEMSGFYDDFTKWIMNKGFTPSGTVYEFYYNSPEQVPESELLTEIRFLLK